MKIKNTKIYSLKFEPPLRILNVIHVFSSRSPNKHLETSSKTEDDAKLPGKLSLQVQALLLHKLMQPTSFCHQ